MVLCSLRSPSPPQVCNIPSAMVGGSGRSLQKNQQWACAQLGISFLRPQAREPCLPKQAPMTSRWDPAPSCPWMDLSDKTPQVHMGRAH